MEHTKTSLASTPIRNRFASLVTAAFAIWNVGIAFVVGVLLYHALRCNLVRL